MPEPSHSRSSRAVQEDEDPSVLPSTTDKSILSPVVLCILVTETGERFAYFGFRAVLTLYFQRALECSGRTAISLFALTTCGAYLSPVAGAVLADTVWGRYQTILRFGIIYVIGLAILTVSAASTSISLTLQRIGSALGLALVCLGTGGIKPCVSAFGADQVSAAHQQKQDDRSEQEGLFRDDDNDLLPADVRDVSTSDNDRSHHVRVFFSYFYFCINVGALTSYATVPIIRGRHGFGAAFLLPTIFMVVAMLLFVSKRKEYVHVLPGSGTSLPHTFRLVWWLGRRNLWTTTDWVRRCFPALKPSPQPPVENFSDKRSILPTEDDNHEHEGSHPDDTDDQVYDAAQILHVFPILMMFPIFWCLYDQQSSVWTLQADRMALHGLQPEQLNVVNPLEIMIFIPLFDRLIYPFIEQHGINISPLRRMSWGMILTAISFSVSGLVESSIQYRAAHDLAPVSVFWQLPQITILAVGEIFFSVTGLEFAYSTSPARLKAFLMALFLLTTAVGDGFSAILYTTIFNDMNMATVMHVCAALMMINFVLFQSVMRWWARHTTSDFVRVPTSEPSLEMQ